MDWGPYSTHSCFILAEVPDKVDPKPVVTDVSDKVQIAWTSPADNGDSLTSFSIWIQGADTNFYQDLTNCPGSDPLVLSCLVPMSVLWAAPFSLPYEAEIYAKVAALNTVGTGEFSDVSDLSSIVLIVPATPTSAPILD
mmetsp:Transcript_29133/g.28187  ORF Transcript_29133/g.28187 Transcript_29133/m.28187 type:complete len:139 (+) Transcript_29133:2060-2476(+)